MSAPATEQTERDHHVAMGHAGDAFAHRYRGDEEQAIASFRLAWEFERRAAMSLIEGELEPSRSILFRSASSLAMFCGELEDSRVLARLGLDGAPGHHVRESLEILAADG